MIQFKNKNLGGINFDTKPPLFKKTLNMHRFTRLIPTHRIGSTARLYLLGLPIQQNT